MPQAQVTAQYVNPPKQPGGKFGSIKTSDGQYWPVPAAIVGQIPKGQPVVVDYEVQTWQGEPKNVIKAVHFGAAAPAYAPQPAPAPQYQPAPTPAPAATGAALQQHLNGNGHAPAAPAHSPAPAMSAAEMEKSRCIFVTGVVQQLCASGNFTAGDLHELTATAASAFDLVLGCKRGQPTPTRQAAPAHNPAHSMPGAGNPSPIGAGLNDEIPF